jgi:uncharacterized protein (TIGR02444 family)
MTDLWQFSCKYYQQEGVQSACIELQDNYQMQVNVLLLMRYLGLLRYQIKPKQISQLLEVTQAIVQKVESIRTVRYSLSLRESGKAWESVYHKLKQAELEAEKIHIDALAQWVKSLNIVQNAPGLSAKSSYDLQSNMKHNVLTYWATQHRVELSSLNIEALPASLLLLAS